MRVFLTGGSGYIGRAIAAALVARGDRPVVLTRDAGRARRALPEAVELVEGDATAPGPWQAAVAGCQAVINLAGENLVARRWDARYRQILHDSRVDATRFLVEAIAAAAAPRPAVLLSASGIDAYGFDADLAVLDDEDEVDESAPLGAHFLGRMCRDWEEEARAAESHGVRVVLLRCALVIGGRDSQMKRWVRVFKWFIGGRLGSGRQWMSWVHLDDVVGAYLFALDTGSLRGPVNVVAPGRVRNREFARQLGRALGRPALFPAPAAALHLVLGEFADYLLHGRPAVPRALSAAGYRFRHPELEPRLFTDRTSAPAG